ncbi:MAG TPA: sulfatase-like hydrolase/transferase [Kofleriaceae bacterium]|jgi:arylsulfatase A-like enzyme
MPSQSRTPTPPPPRASPSDNAADAPLAHAPNGTPGEGTAALPGETNPLGWIVAAHALGGALIGLIECAKVGRAGVLLAVLPLFALTGSLAGVVIAVTTRAARSRTWWQTALIVAAPSLLVTVPVAWTLFDGAFAQTLPMARALKFVLPLVVWGGTAALVAGGRRFMRPVRGAVDLSTRSVMLLACAGLIGVVAWIEQHVLGSGYPGAHQGAAIAIVVLAGCAVRVCRTSTVSLMVPSLLVALSLGTALAAMFDGLGDASDRAALAHTDGHARELVRTWRHMFDRDGDGSSPYFGGGDCNDSNRDVHPGAIDKPGDGIDQDCDGADAQEDRVATVTVTPIDDASDAKTWRSKQPMLAKTPQMNVLMITIDALRFDMLAPDAVDRKEMPNLTQLLDDSVWFQHAIAPASGTDISLTTLLTGRFDPFQPVEWTLPEALQARGHYTASVLPAEVDRYVGETMLKRGFTRQRTVYTDWSHDDIGDHVSAPATSAEGLKAIAAATAPWFVWMHFFDVHEHHQIAVPKELAAQVGDAGGEKRHAYRALLFAIDKEVGRVRQQLEEQGLTDSTIIVFASDHGESLGDDPRLGDTHGKVVYAPLVRIPLAIHVPGVKGSVRRDPVSLVDLAPTILSLLGASDAMPGLDGMDLVPALLDGPAALRPAPDRALAIHEEQQWGVVQWPLHLVVNAADDVVELFDLDADPAEHTDLSSDRGEDVKRLRARYSRVPAPRVDRTLDGRRWRERQAQPPLHREPSAASAATPTP